MRKHHPNNERVKREYLTYLEAAKGRSPLSIDMAAASIALFEECTGFKDFRAFHRAQAIAFRVRQQEEVNARTGLPLAKATILARLMALRDFVIWLATQPGFRSRISYSDADYFRPSANDERIAKASRRRPVPRLDEIRMAFDGMPSGSIIERRDHALFGFILLSGARDDAIASMSLKHIDLEKQTVFQDARQVRTKNAKTFTSLFFPVDPVYRAALSDWIAEMVATGCGPNDPLFPATEVGPGADRLFRASGLTRSHWSNADAIRRIVRGAFERVGLPYFHPHSFRHTLAQMGEKACRTAEEWRAYSQNFGHSSPMTTFLSYGQLAPHLQAEVLAELSSRPAPGTRSDSDELSAQDVEQLLRLVAKARARA